MTAHGNDGKSRAQPREEDWGTRYAERARVKVEAQDKKMSTISAKPGLHSRRLEGGGYGPLVLSSGGAASFGLDRFWQFLQKISV
jgi:hypothetical protein